MTQPSEEQAVRDWIKRAGLYTHPPKEPTV